MNADEEYLDSIKLEESVALQQCIQRIDEKVEKINSWLSQPGGGQPKAVEKEQRKQIEEQKNELIKARSEPYFGRVDFLEDGSETGPEKYYIGKTHIDVDYVYSWQAPIASIYYRDPKSVTDYECPAGTIQGQVVLKRNLTIQNTRLVQVGETYRLLPVGVETEEPLTLEDPLISRLERRRTSKLDDIVATIQPQQYEQIATSPDVSMIIQGAPGSGKSEVGLHRIAYLLSPHNELGLNIEPRRVLFIGPSKFFLRYIDRLLPGLSIRNVEQTTIQDWILARLTHPVKIRTGDWLFERLLTLSKQSLENDLIVTRFKNSYDMVSLINRYIESLLKNLLTRLPDIRVSGKIAIKASSLRAFVRANKEIPVNDLRERLIRYATREVSAKEEEFISEDARTAIKISIEQVWPLYDFEKVYIEMLSNPQRLVELSKEKLSTAETRHMMLGYTIASRTFDPSDLAALSYLDHLLNRIPKLALQHIVVDEGQDVSPLEYYLLYLHSSNNSFTILGDLSQSVIPHRGLENWIDVQKLFPTGSVKRMTVRNSYRSTVELTRFQNRVLGRISNKIPNAIPVGRTGEQPQLFKAKSYEEMLETVAGDIRTLLSKGNKTVSILCKTRKEALRLQNELLRYGLKTLSLDDDAGTGPSIVVASIHQVKGLEFDAVILFNARNYNFPPTWTNNRLLYLAVTRAVHHLHIHWFGDLASILDFSRGPQKANVEDQPAETQTPKPVKRDVSWFRKILRF